MLDDLFTVKEFAEKYPRVRWWQRQREADEEWLTSAGRVLTFEAVCDLLELSVGRACRYRPVVATEECPRVWLTRWIGAPLSRA
jgi:hypothetical protein